jgi:Fe-S cluster biogenesis protein NfuA
MRAGHKIRGLPSTWGLILIAVLAACGSDSSNGQTVAVNLSLIVDARQAHHQSTSSRLFAWIERWFPGATPAWAQQAVTDIASIQVQITGPGIPVPASTTVPVSDPTSGQEIPVSIQAPVGPNRTITVAAFNGANEKIFGGTLPGVNLTAGAPINLEMTLVRLFTVIVQKHPQGTGTGTVTSTPVGIDCGATCSNQFEEGTRVSLNAAAAPGSVFAGWSGGCSGTGACSVTGNATVTARFNIAVSTDRLTVNLAGTGTGTVTSNPSGISCPGSCAADFATGITVTLTATGTNGSTFTSWSGGGCSGAVPSCTVAINGDQAVTATFTAAPVLFTLTVTKAGAGAGTVSSDPPGITACSSTCTANFAPGTVVTLTATPQSGSTFVGWGGACSGAGSCQVTMDANRAVTATFDPPISLSILTVQKMGTGAGRVTSNPSGIDCGPTCAASFATGSSVTLTANASPGSVFVGWSGGGCSGTAPCTTMNTGQTVVATFDLIVVPPDLVTLTVGKQGRGTGTVTSNPAGIFCGPTCQFSYQRGTIVTLTATPDEDSSFNDWHGGPCNNSSSVTCQLVMDNDQTVSAHFDDDD